jgi:hypothetical protein
VLSIVGSESPLAPEPLVLVSIVSRLEKICRVETWFVWKHGLCGNMVCNINLLGANHAITFEIFKSTLSYFYSPRSQPLLLFWFNDRISHFCFTLYYSLTTCVADGEGGPGPRSLSQPKPQFKMRGMGKLRFSFICTQALPPVG